jgi:hypothetical protein
MRWHHWFRNGLTQPRTGRISRRRPPGRGRLRPPLEQFEDRTLLTSYTAGSVSELINDINAANTAGGTNTIALTAPTASPYFLTAVDNTTDGANGLPVIAKKDTLRIIGNGDTIERSTASGTPAFRLFDVPNGTSLTLQNLTLQNGLAFGSGVSADGGAIYNQGALVLSAVIVQSNTAQGSNGATGRAGEDGSGGGVWSGSALTLENSTLVQNNQAIGGAGGFGSRITKAGVGGNGFGGGVFLAGGTVKLTGVSVDNNLAAGGQGGSASGGQGGFANATAGNGSGGGLYIAAGTITLSSDTVDKNQAIDGTTQFVEGDGNAYGGGIYVNSGTVNLSGDVVNDNVAGGLPGLRLSLAANRDAFGGGLYVAAGTVTLSNDTVENNVAIGASFAIGGGLDIASHAKVSIDAFTLFNTIGNTSGIGQPDNIDGPYTRT